MFEAFQIPEVFPLGIILFDILFLLVAIPIEAYILNIRLNFDKKSSTFYAICMNFFSSAIGWFICFQIEPFLPNSWRLELINFVFFNRLSSSGEVLGSVVVFASVAFFLTFLMKLVLLKSFIFSLREEITLTLKTQLPPIARYSRRNSRKKILNTNLVLTVLIANALSYSAILVLLFIIFPQS
ncbi:MAG: filament integrity protein FraC [Cyanobacteria bacterium J06639_18]